MANSILEMLAAPRGVNTKQIQSQKPVMLNRPMNPMEIADLLQDSPPDVGYMPPMEDNGFSLDVAPKMKITPRDVKEFVGAVEPRKKSLIDEILELRNQPQYQPSINDWGKAAYMTVTGDEPVDIADVSKGRFQNDIKQLVELQQLQNETSKASSLAQGGSTMYAAQQIMSETGVDFATAWSMAKSGLGQGYTYGPQGVQAMPGFIPQRGALKQAEGYGSQIGQNLADLQLGADIEEQQKLGQLRGEIAGSREKKASSAKSTLDLISQAKQVLPDATSGGIQTLGAKGKGLVGYSDKATQADAKLNLISAGLTASVPRMEGPQSNFDVQLYQQAAADVGNRTLPYEDRLAALETMEQLQLKYAHLNTGNETQVALPEETPQKSAVSWEEFFK